MAVNGGGGVTLQFQRSPLKAITRTTFLPWNQIVIVNPVVMTPFGGAGIGWDEEDTSLKVQTTKSKTLKNHSFDITKHYNIRKHYSFALLGEIFQALLKPRLRIHKACHQLTNKSVSVVSIRTHRPIWWYHTRTKHCKRVDSNTRI